jgi:hypothetical protein
MLYPLKPKPGDDKIIIELTRNDKCDSEEEQHNQSIQFMLHKQPLSYFDIS